MTSISVSRFSLLEVKYNQLEDKWVCYSANDFYVVRKDTVTLITQQYVMRLF